MVFIETLIRENDFGIDKLPAAEMTNRGLECNLNYKQAGRLLKWEFNAHITYLRNEIINIEEIAIMQLNDDVFDPISVNIPGQPSGAFYGYKIERLFTEEDFPKGGQSLPVQPKARAGDYKFMDINEDGIIDRDDKTIIGDPFPDFTFGFFSNVQFLDFDLSVLLQGTYGNEIFNATKLWLYNPYGLSNWTRDIKNSYRSPKYTVMGSLSTRDLQIPTCTGLTTMLPIRTCVFQIFM